MMINIENLNKEAAKEETQKVTLKCQNCGRFISNKSLIENKAKFHYIPDSQFGPEESYWECEKCS